MPRLSNRYQAILRGILKSDKWAKASGDAAMLFIRLVIASDALGRMRGESHLVYGDCAAALSLRGLGPMDIEPWLLELEGLGLIRRYAIDGGPDLGLQVVDYFEPERKDLKSKPTSEIPAQVEPETLDPRPETLNPMRMGPDGPVCDQSGTDGTIRNQTAPRGATPKKAPKRLSAADKLSALIDAETPAGTDLATVATIGRACEDWRAYRVEAKRSAYTLVSWRKNLKDAWEDPELFVVSVDHSIKKGYQGIFPPKTAAKNGTAPGSYPGQEAIEAFRARHGSQ